MGFYAKDEATIGAGDRATADPQYSPRKCKPGNAIRPISTVGVGYRYYSPSLGRFISRDPLGDTSFAAACFVRRYGTTISHLERMVPSISREVATKKLAIVRRALTDQGLRHSVSGHLKTSQ